DAQRCHRRTVQSGAEKRKAARVPLPTARRLDEQATARPAVRTTLDRSPARTTDLRPDVQPPARLLGCLQVADEAMLVLRPRKGRCAIPWTFHAAPGNPRAPCGLRIRPS